MQNPTFIIVEGTLTESGVFQLRRGYEASHAATGLRRRDDNHGVTVMLVSADGQPLAETSPALHYPAGCDTERTRPGFAVIRAALAYHKDAQRVEVHLGARVVYQANVSSERPPLGRVTVTVGDNGARVATEGTEGQPDLRLLARLKDGRELRPPARREGDTFHVDLRALAGRGEAAFVIEASAGFRTARATTQPISLPAATVHGLIVEPAPERAWPFAQRGSLVGSLFDDNGRRLNWIGANVAWRINGERIADERQVAAWQPRVAGEHQIELIRALENGQIDVLDVVSVTVLAETPAQKEYAALLAARGVT